MHAGTLVGRRVRIVQGSPLVAPSFRFLGGEAGTATGYDEASCELTIALDNPKFGQLNLHTQAVNLHPSGVSQAIFLKLIRHWGRAGFERHVKGVSRFYAAQRAAFLARPL